MRLGKLWVMPIPSEQRFIRETSGMVREVRESANGHLVMRCRIIEAGAGSSGYYMAEVLERDKNALAPIGTKSYWNHPTFTEEWERPERDAKGYAAVQVSEAEWVPGAGKKGLGALDADFEFNDEDRGYVEQFAAHLGMSIYAFAESQVGSVGEYTGEIVTQFLASPFNSVDVVTVPGAGGGILSKVSESLKQHLVTPGTRTSEVATTPISKGIVMDEETKAEFAEVRKALTALTEALTPKAPDTAATDLEAGLELVAESGLPKEVRAAAYKEVRAGASATDVVAAQKTVVESIRKSLVESGDLVEPTKQRESRSLAAPVGSGSDSEKSYAELHREAQAKRAEQKEARR